MESALSSSYYCIRWFVRFFCGQGSCLFWTLTLRPLYRSNAPAQEAERIGRCVCCMCALCMVEDGTVGVSNLSRISKRAPSRRGLLSGISTAWHLFSASSVLHLRLAEGLSHIYLLRGSHVSAADTLKLLIKASTTVTVYMGHHRTLLPARD